MSKVRFNKYTEVTKELLNSIKIGDLIKINNWKTPLIVRGISDNYIVMSDKDNCEYSVIEKKPCEYSYNKLIKGTFSASKDDCSFGFIDSKFDFESENMKQYRFDDKEWINEYLNAFEKGRDNSGISLSSRSGISIKTILISKEN